ncbi:ankyrin repeat domain-containing protein, partial [bacterium]|nr:ankyrin repeat domain-containing protein [bacterium]
EALIELGLQLIREKDTGPDPEAQAAARLIRAAEIAQMTEEGRVRKALLEDTGGFFASAHPRFETELQPARRLVRQEAERQLAAAGWAGRTLEWFLLIHLGSLFTDPLDRYAYVDGLFQRLVHADHLPRAQRVAPAANLVCRVAMPLRFYEGLLDHPDCEIRFAAHGRLAGLCASAADRERHTVEALQLVDCAYADRGLVDRIRRAMGRDQRYLVAPVQLMEQCPARQQEAAAALARRFHEWLDAGDWVVMLYCEPERMLPYLPVPAQLDLIDKFLALASRPPQPEWCRYRVDRLWKIRRELMDREGLPPRDPNEIAFTTLLSTRAPEWQRVAKDVAYSGAGQRARGLTAQRLYRDGDTLWIALGDAGGPHAVGLIELDLKTGRIASFRHGQVPAQDGLIMRVWSDDDPIWRSVNVQPLCRWGDYLCVPERGTGVLLFPVRCSAGDHSLQHVLVLDDQMGLPSRDVIAVAGLGDSLYLGTGPLLLQWSRGARRAVLVANLASELGDSPLGTGSIGALFSDEARGILYAMVRRDHNAHLWRRPSTTGKWEQIVSPMVPPSYLARRIITDFARVVLPGDGSLYLGCVRDVPGRGPVPMAHFDTITEQFTTVTNATLPEFTLPPGYAPHEDVLNFENGSLVLDGAYRDWRLLFAKRAGDPLPASLSWAVALAAVLKPVVPEENTPPRPPIRVTASSSERRAFTSLLDAARLASPEVLEQLIQQGADVNQQREFGMTPLHAAATVNRVDNIRVLLKHGADPTIKSHGGRLLPYLATRGENEARIVLEEAMGVWLRQNKGTAPEGP